MSEPGKIFLVSANSIEWSTYEVRNTKVLLKSYIVRGITFFYATWMNWFYREIFFILVSILAADPNMNSKSLFV